MLSSRCYTVECLGFPQENAGRDRLRHSKWSSRALFGASKSWKMQNGALPAPSVRIGKAWNGKPLFSYRKTLVSLWANCMFSNVFPQIPLISNVFIEFHMNQHPGNHSFPIGKPLFFGEMSTRRPFFQEMWCFRDLGMNSGARRCRNGRIIFTIFSSGSFTWHPTNHYVNRAFRQIFLGAGGSGQLASKYVV